MVLHRLEKYFKYMTNNKNMVRVWENHTIVKTKHVRALNKDYVVIERKANDEQNQVSGLYYIEVKFHEIAPHGKLSEYILQHSDTDLQTIVESPRIDKWDALGTPLVFAVSYVLKIDNATNVVFLKVLSVSEQWALCQEDVLDNTPTVKSLEIISPPCDYSRVYVLYGTDRGLDGGRH